VIRKMSGFRLKQPPCAGITLIRFCGYDLSLQYESTPGNTEVGSKLRKKTSGCCNLFFGEAFYFKMIDL
jgi:hypothetical protein